MLTKPNARVSEHIVAATAVCRMLEGAASHHDPLGDVAPRVPTTCRVVRPSVHVFSRSELWRSIMARSPLMRRAFFSPAFALATERAGCRSYVGVLADQRGVCGFLPFQFRNAWHQSLGLAERVGGELSQGACLVAWPGVTLSPLTLLALCGLFGNARHSANCRAGAVWPVRRMDAEGPRD